MRLSKALQEKLMDVRLIDKFLAEGRITSGAVDKNLKELPDEVNNLQYTASRTEHKQEE